jgi:hypothetical protein
MALTLSTQAITSGSFGSFTNGMATDGAGKFYGAFAPLSLAGTIFDLATLMPSAGGSVNVASIGGTLPAFGVTPTFNFGTLNGAATAVKQPALGIAGTPSADVLSIQGLASMTPVKVDGSGVTQPVSLAVAPPLAAGAVTQVSNSGGTTFSRPATTPITSSVTCTGSGAMTVTWTAHQLLNGQAVVLGGTPVPSGGTAPVAGVPCYVIGRTANTFQLALTPGGTAITSTTTGTSVTATLCYPQNSVIAASTATNPALSTITMARNVNGNGFVRRMRLLTNATSGWNVALMQVGLWSVAPTYTNGGDGFQYGIATGAANFLGYWTGVLNQMGDGAAGILLPLNGGELGFALSGGVQTLIFDLAYVGGPAIIPIVGQTFTLTPEAFQN